MLLCLHLVLGCGCFFLCPRKAPSYPPNVSAPTSNSLAGTRPFSTRCRLTVPFPSSVFRNRLYPKILGGIRAPTYQAFFMSYIFAGDGFSTKPFLHRGPRLIAFAAVLDLLRLALVFGIMFCILRLGGAAHFVSPDV